MYSREDISGHQDLRSSVTRPNISVVVPFCANERSVLDCLKSIFDMDYPAEKLEVIAINDGGDNSISQAVKEQFAKVVLVHNDINQGHNAVKEFGAEIASGDILAYTDADCTVSSSWAQVIERHLSEAGTDAVTGSVRHPRTFLRELIGIADFPDSQGDECRRVSAFVGCNYAIHRHLLRSFKLNNCNLRVGSDRLLSWRIHSAGYMITYDPSMRVDHFPQVNIGSLLERRLRYGRKALAMRMIDPTLPGGSFARLGPFASPAYVSYKLVKDTSILLKMMRRGLVNPYHVPFLFPSLILCRMLDSIGILAVQCSRE